MAAVSARASSECFAVGGTGGQMLEDAQVNDSGGQELGGQVAAKEIKERGWIQRRHGQKQRIHGNFSHGMEEDKWGDQEPRTQ